MAGQVHEKKVLIPTGIIVDGVASEFDRIKD